MSAPPRSEIYRVADYKAQLARGGVAPGFAAYAAAYPQTLARLESRPFGSLHAYAREAALDYRELDALAGSAFHARKPKTIGETDARDFSGRARHFFLAALADATVAGRSAVIRAGGRALIDVQGSERARGRDRYELDQSIFCIEGDTAHLIVSESAPERTLDEAFVALLGPHSDAFGHWVWHQLPRFVASLDAGALPPMPLLVDRGMPPSHREALELITRERALPIVELGAGERVRVGRAWYASTPFWIPYLPVSDATWTWAHMAAPPTRWQPIIAAFRCSAAHVDERAPRERIFLARREHLRRRLVNASSIEALALARGFAIVYPEELSFAEQVRTVRSARYIAGPEGSAMMLSLFARESTRLLILDHPFRSQLTNLTAPLEASGIDVTVITGEVVSANDTPGYPNFGFRHFADYAIDEGRFSTFLDAWAGADRADSE